MELLENPIRHYAWGSHTAIAAVQGRKFPAEQPEAELWMGAHPGNPSAVVADGRSLLDVIAADPVALLGADNVRRFGERLPFLMKVLAADAPLSIQAHPDAAQARAGFDAEETEQIPLDATVRNYVDPYHKPELLVAMSEFDALCGFRDPVRSAELLARLDVPALAPTVDLLRHGDPGQALREAVTTVMTVPESMRGPLLDQVVAACAALAGDGEDGRTYAMAAALGKAYPGDIGVLLAMMLNHVVLQPGEAIYMPAGNAHAYLRGVGVEIMAASDNVLRGGLTAKHIDVPELLRVLRYEPLADPRVTPVEVAPGVSEWPTPMPEFRLTRARVGGLVDEAKLIAKGPRVFLCWSGQVRLDDGVSEVTLLPGQAAFVSADAGDVVTATGFGELYQAAVS
ncbi:mannose-6-phosphate isomerase, class I [Actinorhabdospora filicis]|uniref:mannose-6-phosphate isomerase n=1 Tax=Actinorhabdospora filicis TaxID=1785913 RepID=A0A9W6SFQ3_9ACTN|nr:mannose-6-phosphate isomerase, class I [Actinorhabdospora filicis]GLZ76315.1 mannose-6-phosphate isomerase, class I [Actinorhabdospora filicis]